MIKCTVPLALAAMLSVASPVLAASNEHSSVIPLPFTSQEAFAPPLLWPGTNILQKRDYRIVSMNGQRYRANYWVVGGTGYSESTSNDSLWGAASKYQVILIQFVPYTTTHNPANILRVNVRLKDGVDGYYDLDRTAVKFPEANWAFPADVIDELKPLDGTCYVFKHDGSDTSPLTFHLP